MTRSVSLSMKVVPLQGSLGAFPGACSELHDFLADNQSLNMPMSTHLFSEPEDTYVPIPCPPERLLMLAIVERATRDLETHVERYYRKTAIKWFRDGFKGKNISREGYISFVQCLEVLEFNQKELDFLKNKVHEAEQFELTIRGEVSIQKIFKAKNPYKFKKERKSYRASTRALLARERLLECKALPTI